jgi:hypothetical protein
LGGPEFDTLRSSSHTRRLTEAPLHDAAEESGPCRRLLLGALDP